MDDDNEDDDNETVRRIRICLNCPKFDGSRGCIYFLKRCSVVKMWKSQLPPPDKCPNAMDLTNGDAM